MTFAWEERHFLLFRGVVWWRGGGVFLRRLGESLFGDRLVLKVVNARRAAASRRPLKPKSQAKGAKKQPKGLSSEARVYR